MTAYMHICKLNISRGNVKVPASLPMESLVGTKIRINALSRDWHQDTRLHGRARRGTDVAGCDLGSLYCSLRAGLHTHA